MATVVPDLDATNPAHELAVGHALGRLGTAAGAVLALGLLVPLPGADRRLHMAWTHAADGPAFGIACLPQPASYGVDIVVKK